jgi:oligopeptidase B
MVMYPLAMVMFCGADAKMIRSRRTLPIPPQAEKQPHAFSCHNEDLIDNYAWLKAENWQEALQDPSTLPAPIRTHLEAENAYTKAILWGLGSLRKTLVHEMRGRIREDESSPPVLDGDFAYFTRFREGGEYPLIGRTKREGGEEELLLDGEKLARGKAFFDMGTATHSPDHRLLAWSADEKGSEFYTIRVRDLDHNRDLPVTIAMTGGDVVWLGDSSGFLYIELDASHRPVRVRRHILGTIEDDILYEETQPGWFLDLGETQSGRYAVIGISDHETAESWLFDLHDPQAKPVCIAQRQTGILYEVEHHEDRLILLTNAEGAEDFQLVSAPLATPGPEYWQVFLPHQPSILLLEHSVFQHHLVRLEREEAKPRLVIRNLKTGKEHSIAFDEDCYSLSYEAGLEYDTTQIRFTVSSLTSPARTYDYDMETRERRLIKEQDVPSGHDPALYRSRRILAKAQDGETVPISLLWHKDTKLDGRAPCLLYGYGAYGHALSAGFRTNPLSLIGRGFVYAIAHVRGGTEKGWRWYREGKREKKPNTFHDFLACAETLIAEGYTAKGRIVAHGGSAGGMLMGAVANLAPSLFAAVIADVPFVDVLNTMLDGALPLTPPEWPEWGNPVEDEEAFAAIRSYSPYDNIKAQPYPAILALAGLTDPRVTYWEPAKWVAKLRAHMTGGGPVLLHTNMTAGHGGASGRFDSLNETALIYAFALKIMSGLLNQTNRRVT